MAGTTGFNDADEDYLNEIISQVKERYRFSEIDNLISIPLDQEISMSVFDSLAEINGQAPETFFTLEDLMLDTPLMKYRALLYQGAAAKTLITISADWVANGLDASVASGEIEIPNRFSDIDGMAQTLIDRFYDRVERYKQASEKYAFGISTVNQKNHIFGTPANRGNNTTGSNGRLY